MLKFIRGKGQQPSAERQKIQKELFAFRKTVQHGFPNKPTALAWDQELCLLCIGTASGAIKVFGRPGVEFYGQHAPVAPSTPTHPGMQHSEAPPVVSRLVCLPRGQGRLVSLCDDNSLHLWEIDECSLVEVKSLALEGKLKKISAMCVESEGTNLLLGTEGGNIYLLDLNTFTMASDIIYQDVVMQKVPEDYKLNPGAVECLAEQPGQPDQILIGYNRGLMVLWDRGATRATQTFISQQQLESISWHEDAQHFTSSHNDGSYSVWNVNEGEKPSMEPTTPYGPYPCKAITKLLQSTLGGESLIVFMGGMPRASYGDKYTVTVINGDSKHVVFDFTSRVIDFFFITPPEATEPDSLLVLAEEELVAVDLLDENWRMLAPPYLVSLHASAVTCAAHAGPVPQDIWDSIVDAGRNAPRTHRIYSEREWPIAGGYVENDEDDSRRELLLTGHEDGTVRFWNASGVALTPLYKYSTAVLFSGEEISPTAENGEDADEEDEEWPPFRKIGVFDPYSDDPRLAVKKVSLCPISGTLVVAGTAGNVVVAKLNAISEDDDKNLKVTTMNIVNDRDGFVWKGHDELSVRKGAVSREPQAGFHACGLLQLHPPASITCIALHSEWGLVAAGTGHGLALYDYLRNRPVIVKCTLNPNDLTGAGDTPISRRKSFKKSLRESFRRLRKGRTTRRTVTSPTSPTGAPVPAARKTVPAAGDVEGTFNPLDSKPIERQVEARPVDDSLGSMVRCLYFARSFLVSVQNTTPTLWAGTNNGTVYVFTVAVPVGSKRQTEDVGCQLGKEIQLKHRAPVIAIAVLDGAHRPLPEPLEAAKPDCSQPHRVVIASEEQFKVFSLPSLKPFCKYKLTAHEGARVRRMAFADFTCTLPDTKDSHTECCLLCLTNLGDCLVLSVPELRRQLNAAAIRREDINGISSLVFTRGGEALYLHSSSELQRITVSATNVTAARCRVRLARPQQDATSEQRIEGTVHVEAASVENAAPAATQLTNGDSAVENKDEIRENGEESGHDVTISSSIGDITIDSVKDHLANNSIATIASSTLSNGEDGSPSRSMIVSTIQSSQAQQQNVIVKTTTTTITSGTVVDGELTESTTSTTTTSHQAADNIVERAVTTSGAITRRIVETNRVIVKGSGNTVTVRAPLACSEELESDSIVTVTEA